MRTFPVARPPVSARLPRTPSKTRGRRGPGSSAVTAFAPSPSACCASCASKRGVSGDLPGRPVMRLLAPTVGVAGSIPWLPWSSGLVCQARQCGKKQTKNLHKKQNQKTPQKTNEVSQPASPSPVWHSSCTGLPSQMLSGFLLRCRTPGPWSVTWGSKLCSVEELL